MKKVQQVEEVDYVKQKLKYSLKAILEWLKVEKESELKTSKKYKTNADNNEIDLKS